MKKEKWKLGCGVVAVFFLGMIAGGITIIAILKKVADKTSEDPEVVHSMIVKSLDQKLKLSDAQREEISPIVQEMIDEIIPIREETRDRLGEVVQRHSPRIRAQLDPEQEKAYDLFLEKLGRKWRIMLNIQPEEKKSPKSGPDA